MSARNTEDLLWDIKGEQQLWVAIRCAMRVLPALGVRGDFGFVTEPETMVTSIAELPFLLAISIASEIVADREQVIRRIDAARSATPAYASPPPGYGVAATGAYAAATYAADAATYADDDSATGYMVAAAGHAAKAAGAADASSDAEDAMRTDVELLLSTDDRPTCWVDFFSRPLWDGPGTPKAWQQVVSEFRKALSGIDRTDLADRYERHCDRGVDWEEVQQWLFGKTIVDIPSGKSDVSTETSGSRAPVPVEIVRAMQADDWWTTLLFWMAVEKRERMDLLGDPKARMIRSELSHATSGELSGIALHELHKRLADAYGALTPSPLWTAWMKHVHGETIAELRDSVLNTSRK